MKKGFSLKGIGKVEKNINACVKLHKLIDSGDEQGAINLINSEKDIDVSYEYNQILPIFSAITSNMCDLLEVIVNHPTFDYDVEDGFGESVLQSLLYLYGSKEVTNTESNRVAIERMIKAILKNNSYEINAKDLNNDTVLIVSCDFNSLNWVTKELLLKKDIDINAVNDVGRSALTTAIKRKNLEAITMLSKMRDLVVRDIDREEAKKANIDLSEYGL
jgi:ankyrin repeat protein